MILRRKATRIPGYPYTSRRYYFVTICVNHFEKWFGEVVDEQMILNNYGRIVEKVWYDLLNHYYNCGLCDFVIMPNHVHGVICVGEGLKPSPVNKTHGLCEMVRGFKSFSSRNIHLAGGTGFRWQRSFYDYIVRNEEDMYRIQEYIENNPLQWELDEYYKKGRV